MNSVTGLEGISSAVIESSKSKSFAFSVLLFLPARFAAPPAKAAPPAAKPAAPIEDAVLTVFPVALPKLFDTFAPIGGTPPPSGVFGTPTPPLGFMLGGTLSTAGSRSLLLRPPKSNAPSSGIASNGINNNHHLLPFFAATSASSAASLGTTTSPSTSSAGTTTSPSAPSASEERGSPLPSTFGFTSPLSLKSVFTSPLPFKSVFASPLPFKSVFASPLPFRSAFTSPLPSKSVFASPVPSTSPSILSATAFGSTSPSTSASTFPLSGVCEPAFSTSTLGLEFPPLPSGVPASGSTLVTPSVEDAAPGAIAVATAVEIEPTRLVTTS